MLTHIPRLLGPDLPACANALVHGNEIICLDRNHPALEHGRRVVRASSPGPVPPVDTVIQLLPVDDIATEALFWSTVGPDGECLNALHGQAFYGRARAVHLVVATDEPAHYANIILRKSLHHPPAGSPT